MVKFATPQQLATHEINGVMFVILVLASAWAYGLMAIIPIRHNK
jgi:hypothetical protein